MCTMATDSFKNRIFRSGGLVKVAVSVAKEGKLATLKLPYSATIGQVANVVVGRAGSIFWLRKHLVAVNAIDHSHESGEERAPIGGNKRRLPKTEDDKLFRGSAITERGAYAAVSYMSCSVLLILFNKAALSSYSFPCSNVITLFQLITLESVRGVNVPMYTTLRRTTVVFTMIMEFLLVGQKYTSFVVGSVGLIVLGAFVAGARDVSFDFHGYAIVFLANITTAMYLTTVARIGKSSGLNSFGLMWCNGIICGPVLMLWAFLHGDLKSTMNFPHLFSPGFLVVLICSCILAFFLNYTIFLNTTLNSAVAQTICGNLKDLFTIGLGWIFFGGLPFDILNVFGQMLSFVGSGLYAYYKLMSK